MSGITSQDHAFPNGGGSVAASAVTAGPGGMTTGEKAAVSDMISKDEDKGATVHAFDPDATPGQKAALAGAAKAQLDALPKLKGKKEADAGVALGMDTSSAGNAPIPTITLTDMDQVSKREGQVAGGDAIPGSIPTSAAPAVPTWVTVGWRQAAGLEATALDSKKQADAGILADYVSEQMYGAWYHNAGIIVFTCLATRLITLIGLGFAWIIIILAFAASYYSLSITRTRNRARDDIQRELVKPRLVTETESADWLNGFLDRFWLIYEPVLSQTIVASVDAVLLGATPSFCESIRMTTFTLGTKAPRIDFVRTFPKTPEDIVIMDWALSFTPNDLLDITPRQAQKRVNPKIVLTVRVGVGALSKGIPILLEDMEFTGKMRIKLKLMTNFPHVKTVELSFIEQPTFDYVLKPMVGFDINNIPGLAPFIREQVHAALGPMMYDPNVFTIDLESLLSGTPLDAAIGVLKVTINDARGLKATKFGGGEPDPYVSFALGAKPVITKTRTIESTSNPSFQETQFILVNTLADVLNLGLWDYNEHRADSLLGTVAQELAFLNEDAEREGLVGKIISGGKDRGELRYDLSFFPVLKPAKNPDGTFETLPDTSTGIVRLTIHQAKDLDITREHGPLNPFTKVFLGGSRTPVHKTPILKRQNQPIWESHCEFLVPEKHSSVITIQVVDSKDFAQDPVLGLLTVKLSDLLEMKERGQDWLPLQKSRAGKIRVTAEWKPVAMAGSLSGAAAYVPPIGILRVWLKRATDVKNVEGTLGGKSDPYVRVMGNNKVLARTEVQNNNLNPEWDQIVYVPVHNLRESLILEVMDYQNIGKDRSLGYVELRVADCAEPNKGGSTQEYPYASKGHQVRNERIKLDKANSYKGNLIFEVDFKPALSLKGGVSFEQEKNELQVAAERARQFSVAPGVPGSTGVSDNHARAEGTRASIAPISTSAVVNGVSGGQPTSSGSGTATPGESKGGGEATPAENPEQGVEMSKEELLSRKSGVLVFQLVSGNISRRGSVEVMFDDGYWPSFTSTRARSNHQKWDQIGEGFIRELDFSRIWLRINANDDSEKEEVVAEFRCDTREFLEMCLDQPAEFLLSQPDGSNRSTLTLSARYVPVEIKLEPRESINNMGVLRVEVLRAKDLLAVDRGGKSDPNVTFILNGMKVFKSETKKKTLNPEWNEHFEVMIPSRVGAKFEFEINDWDRVGTSDLLGAGKVDLASLTPFDTTELTLPVIHEKKGEHGRLQIRTMFQPEIIARTRNKTSTFSTAGRAITQVGGLPIAAGKGVIMGGGAVAMGVGHGIGSVGGFAGRKIGLIKRKDKSGKEVLVPAGDDESGMDGFEVSPDASRAGQSSVPLEDGVEGRSKIGETNGGPPSEPGTLIVTVLGGKDLKSEEGPKLKSYLALKVGSKGHKTDNVKGVEPEWNETFNFATTLSTTAIGVAVHGRQSHTVEHHTLGRDPLLGEAEVDIWRHISPSSPSADVSVELLNGSGLVRLRLEWMPGQPERTGGLLRRTRSISSLHPDHQPGQGSPGNSKLGGLRMSLSRKDKDKDGEAKE